MSPIKPTTGEKYSWKEFFKEWKKGMQEVTPLQQAVTVQLGQLISAIGVIWGIIFSIRIGYWWMGVILVGGLIVLGVQYLGNWQKKVILKQMDLAIKSADLSDEHLGTEVTIELNDNREVKNELG